ncbi:MerR family transcriptional regulator [Fusobacterium sp.]|uniref:MerR family transcriptional regulator n=1 Tax=Fusobacterium sp. TaxID=68766 RepID=UPI0025BFAFF4|nr:MerR family transcriptional regulator [Fusobacterium sp.]
MKDEKINKGKFNIGKVEKICNIGKKTLRYYDQIGLLSPSEIKDNGYRYYDKENLYTIPVIKYYKQSGFTLEKIKSLLSSSNHKTIEEGFEEKILELKRAEEELKLKRTSIEDWYSLVREARMIKEFNLSEIKVKYLEKAEVIFLDQEFDYDYLESIINVEFTNYIEKIDNAITGPVMIEFPSFEERLNNEAKKVRILQKGLKIAEKAQLVEIGGCLVVSAYHIGSHKTINNTYEKIKKWIELYNYKTDGACYERYILDYWTTKEESNFVTEIMIKLKTDE